MGLCSLILLSDAEFVVMAKSPNIKKNCMLFEKEKCSGVLQSTPEVLKRINRFYLFLSSLKKKETNSPVK